MTSLAHQLKRLALPQNDASLLSCRNVVSLLFDPKDASTMDRCTFYALGCTGLEELMGIEPSFQEFEDSLFSQASLTLERSVQSKEVNQKLDKDISLFLCRLSPYFLLKPAHKCLEWLLHRFHIQLYNVDALMACALPYYDTNIFVRVLQLLRIQEATNRWNWLHCLQKPGVPLSRTTLVTHCYSDLSFMDFICSMVTKSIQAYSGLSGSCSQLRVIFSFYASTIVSALETMDKVSESIVSKLLPYIQRGLKSTLTDYKAATYMIVCQLAVKVVMEAGLVDSLAVHISKSLLKEPVLAKEGLGCLVVLLQNQTEGAAGHKAFSRLCSMTQLVSTLEDMAALHDVSPLLRHLLPYLVQQIFISQTDDETETDKLHVLESLLKTVPLTKGLDQTVARMLLDQYLCQTTASEEEVSALDQRLLPLVQLFESRYCAALDGVLSGHVSDLSSSSEQKRLFHRFLSLSVSSGKFQILGDSDTSLFLSLKHPLSSVRVSAVEHLMDVVTSGQEQQSLDQVFLRGVVMDSLKDDVPEVVSAALKVVEVLFDDLDPEDIMSSLLSLLSTVELRAAEQWLPVLTEALRLLSDPRLEKGDAERLQRAGWKLLPLLVVTSARQDSAELSFTSCVARSRVIAKHPLTLNWAKELDSVMKEHSGSADLVALVNERLVVTLTKNLYNMEHFSKRETLEKLAVLVEQQQNNNPRGRASVLVLTRILLLSLDQLRESLHLLMAQRVFLLLERPLLDFIARDNGQGSQCPASVPSSFADSLTLFLSECERRWNPGDHVDLEFSLALMSLLSDFISAMKCHDASFKGDTWWNPEKMDTNTCLYLGLMCRVFSIIISGAAEGPAAGRFRILMKLFVQLHLQEPLHLFRFLCLLWGYGSNHGDQLELKVSAVLQTRALYAGQVLLGVQTTAALQELTAADSPVVPSLLCCLTSPLREVRRAALAAVQTLSGAGVPLYQPIMEKLMMTSEEVLADPAYLSLALSVLHEESSSSTVKKRREALQASLQQLLSSVQMPGCPSYTAAVLLRALSNVNGESVLLALLPVLDRLLEQSTLDSPVQLLRSEAQLLQLVVTKFNEASAAMLARDSTCLDLFVRALRSSLQPHPDVPSCQISTLEQITKSFFLAIDDETVQQQLLKVMFDLLVENRSPLVANTISSVFKRISVDAQLVANEISPPEKKTVGVTVQQTRRSKMSLRKAQDSVEVSPDEGTVPWQRVTLILELLQHKKKLKRAETLVPALFSLLSRSLEPSSANDDTNIEYIKQLLLSCLLNICNKVAPEGGPVEQDVLKEDKFSVELVVQCIRTSDVPQTHHHALLLLGTTAAIFPEKVLHNIMPIFTFMGANILRLDDAYSFRVIDKTVQMVIPALIKAHQLPDGQSSAHILVVVTRIMHVFADALPHVPDHRRLPVLTQLVTTMGPAHFLWVLMLLLFKLRVLHTASFSSEKDGALDQNVDFWISLCGQFEVSDIITTVINVLKFQQKLPHDKDDAAPKPSSRGRGAKKKKEAEETAEELIFDVETHSSKELRHFNFLSVSFTAQLLGSNTFIAKVSDCGDAVDQTLQQKLLEEVLRYIHTVARAVEQNADKTTAKFWRVLLNKGYEVLDKVNALLPTDTFITVVRGLMGNELASVRRKAMELLNNKLHQRTRWGEQQVSLLLQLTSDLLTVVGKGPGGEKMEEEEVDINRQTALYSLKLLCRNFGSDHKEVFVPVLLKTLDIVESEAEEKNVMGSALLCAAEVVAALKALAIPHLPRLMPAVLRAVQNRKDLLTSSDIYLLSVVSSLQKVTETLPHFISPYLQDVTQQVCLLSRLADKSQSSSPSPSSEQLCLRLAALRKNLANQIPPRVLLPALCSSYANMVQDKKAQLGALMSILKEHIAQMEKEQLNVHQSELTSFFLTALDYRARHCQDDLERASQTEGHVIDCLLSMVMKLSEVSFRPLFFKLFDWSKSDSSERLLTFYRLTDSIAERLKGLFVLFAGNLVKAFSDLLRQNHSASTDKPLLDREDKRCLLLDYVLDCLHKIFLYDTHKFLSKERADALMLPLVEQLENTLGGAEVYQQRVLKHLVPCLGQFSVALNDDSLWKTLNYQILLKTRHTDSRVRFSALVMLMELASKLKENYMVLLPETIPFLAELMEDECEEVEQQVHKVVQEMENILGEPLQSYF